MRRPRVDERHEHAAFNLLLPENSACRHTAIGRRAGEKGGLHRRRGNGTGRQRLYAYDNCQSIVVAPFVAAPAGSAANHVTVAAYE